MKHHKKGLFKEGEVVVCTLTGHGLKDPDTAMKYSKKPLSAPPKSDKVAKLLKL